MKAAYILEAQQREATGRGAARALRRTGQVPAILYSSKLQPVSFSLAEKDLDRVYKKGGLPSKLLEIKLAGKSYFALTRDLQTHPVSDRIEHADFLQVDADSRVNVQVPVKVVGSDRSQGLKRGGSLNIVRHTVELICAPENIPGRILVDIKDMQIGDSLHISHVALPENVTPAIRDRDFTLVTITGRNKADDESETAAPAEGAAAAPAAGAKAA